MPQYWGKCWSAEYLEQLAAVFSKEQDDTVRSQVGDVYNEKG